LSSHTVATDEDQRLQALASYNILDTAPEVEFDRLARLAARLFNVPIVLVSLLPRDHQFFKAHIGVDICSTSRDVSFCAHAILQDDILFIPDAREDSRFAANPLVLGSPFIRFYAGCPLVTPCGHKIGTVCLIDNAPRHLLTEEDRKNLRDIASMVMDRLELRRLNYRLSASQTKFECIAKSLPDAVICLNSQGCINFWNKSAESLFGYKPEEILGNFVNLIIDKNHIAEYEEEIERIRGISAGSDNQTLALTGIHKSGSRFLAEFHVSLWKEEEKVNYGIIVRDITGYRENEDRLFRLASLDALTDLPNLGAWRARLGKAAAGGEAVTVLLVDLDGFKEVNDTFGHSVGDTLLKEVAARLLSVREDTLMAARLGDDEFAVLLPGNDAGLVGDVAGDIVSALARPYDISGRRIELAASVGISLSSLHGERSEELLGAADLALYRAKTQGKGRFEVFTPALREAAVARRVLEQELKRAFERSEFELFYQPQYCAKDRKLTGAEALIRWNHPERGLLTPAAFIEVLGKKPSAPAVGQWILHTACRQAAEWRRTLPDFRMGINLFEAQFRTRELVENVTSCLREYALSPDALELEIVENIILKSDATTLMLLHDLRNIGVGLAFDDYGTGFASLSLLKRYPVTRLKIDRSFIRDADSDPENEALVRAVLYLGRSFGMDVIAEGVETEAQMEFLQKHNCPEVQGYLLGHPAPPAVFQEKYLTGQN
jgi:diguanylate cyclase (GGDEF)-like protein/PAS domain S-box-containing protein